MNKKIKYLVKTLAMTGVFGLSLLGGISAANAACTGVSLDQPLGGEFINGTYDINFTRNSCDENITAKYARLSQTGDATCANVSGWTDLATISDPGTSYSWDTTSGSYPDDNTYCVIVTNSTGNPESRSTQFTIDNTAPTVTSTSTKDSNMDGVIDQIVVTIDDNTPIGSGMGSCEAAGWVVTDNDGNATPISVDSCTVDSLTQVTLNVTPTTPADFYTDSTPTVEYTAGGNNNKDRAGNELASYAATDAIDGAAPAPVAAEYQDTSGNGTVDTVVVTLSEPVGTYTDDNAAWSFTNNGDLNMSVVSGSKTDNVITLTVTADPDETSTPNNTPQVVYTDTATSVLNDGISADQTGPTTGVNIEDKALPFATSIYYYDLDHNGSVDSVNVYYSENISHTHSDSDWTVTDNDVAITSGIGTVTDHGSSNISYITLTVNGAAGDTGLKNGESSVPTLTYSNGGNNIVDSSGNIAANFSNRDIEDKANPIVTSATLHDTDSNGKLDSVDLVFSEKMDYSSISAGEFSLDGTLADGINNGGDADDDETVTLTFSTEITGTDVKELTFTNDGGTITANTSVGTSNLLRNVAAADLTETDGAGPAIISAETIDQTHFKLVFSEPVSYASIANGDLVYSNAASGGDININTGDYSPASDASVYTITVANSFAVDEYNAIVKFSGAGVVDDKATSANSNSQTSSVTIDDGIAPVITARETGDADANGQIDNIKLTFSENLDFSTFSDDSANGFAVAGYTVVDVCSTDNCTGDAGNVGDITDDADTNIVYLKLTEKTNPDTDATPVVSYTAGVITDSNGVQLADDVGAPADDKSLPVVISQKYEDNGGDGSVDTAVLVFSEPVNFTEAQLLDDWTFVANNLTGFAGNPTAIAGNSTNTLTFTVSATTDLTGVSGGTEPTVAFTDDGTNHIVDGNSNNLLNLNATSLSDNATPVLLTSDVATKTSGDGNGNTSNMSLKYSEDVSANTSNIVSDYLVEVAGTANEITVNSVGLANDIVTLNLDTTDVDQTTAQLQVSYVAGVIKDSSNNGAVVQTDTAINDKAEPIAIYASIIDSDLDGILDRVSIKFSEDINKKPGNIVGSDNENVNFSVSGTDFVGLTIGDVISDGNKSGGSDSTDLSLVSVKLNGITTKKTDIGNLKVDFTSAGSSLIGDSAGNVSPTFTFDSTTTPVLNDEAAPYIISREYEDNDSDGTVDRIKLVFSENLDDDVASMASSDFSVTVNGSTDAGNGEMIETLNIGIADDDTIYVDFTNGISDNTNADYEIAVSANKVGDVAGNLMGASSATNADDMAKPHVTSITYSNNPANDVDDTVVTVVMSEDLTGGTPPVISIDQQGSTDITNAAMTTSDNITYTYNYDVNMHNGSTYIDGQANVSITAAVDSNSNAMTSNDSTSSFMIQTVVVNTESITIDNNNPEKDDTVTLTADATTNFGNVAGAKIIATKVSDGSVCTLNLPTSSASDGAYDEVNETISTNLDFSDNTTTCVEGATPVDTFFVANNDYKLSIVGQDSVSGQWEAIDTENSLVITLNVDSNDTTAPTISVMHPSDDSTDQSISSDIFVEFDEALDATTVNSNNVILKKYSDDSSVDAVISMVEGDKGIKINPNNDLDYSTQYYITVSTGVKDLAGNALVTAWDVSNKADHEFTTEADTSDTTAPTLSNVGSSGLAQESANIKFDSNEAGSVRVYYGETSAYGNITTWQAMTASADQTVTLAGLTCGTTYHYVVNAKDGSGNETNSGDQTFTTTACTPNIDTTAPQIVSTTPTNAATYVSVSAGKVKVTFDEATAGYDFDKFTLVKVSDNSSVSTIKTSAGNLEYGVWHNVLEYNTSYKFTIEAGAVWDSAGNLNEEKVVYFTTQSADAPVINSLNLSNLTNTGATINWSTDINADSMDYRINSTMYSGTWTAGTVGGTSGTENFSGLSANTTYYYQVRFYKNGEVTESVPVKFTTARGANGLYVDSISTVKSTAKYDATNPYTNGWHFRFKLTADSFDEDQLTMKLDNWVSGSNAFTTSDNTKILVSSTGGDYTEAQIAAGTSVTTTYASGTAIDISSIADSSEEAGKQFYVDLYVKIPSGQEPGSYSTSYGFINETAGD